jgi:hypothetical protein
MRHDFLARQTLVVLVFASIVFLASSGYAQRIFGDILGTVTDSSGAAVRDAKITLHNLDTGRALIATTTTDGAYSFVEQTPGRYEVTAERQGFEQKVFSNVRLSADQRVRVDISLAVGAVSTVVQVEAGGAELVQTETHEISEVVETGA